MEDFQSKIIHDLSILYELSLTSSNSKSVLGNCASFLKVLMSRKNLSFGGYWTISEENLLETIYTLPELNDNTLAVAELNCLEQVNHLGAIIDKNDGSDYKILQKFTKTKEGNFLLFKVGERSVIILNRAKKNLDETDKNQLNNAINKFGIFIEGLISQEKLKEEIEYRKAAEKALKSKQKELEKYIDSNLQLENFAYIASHDLKAPLRNVTSFAKLLKENEYESLSEKSKSFLDIIIKSSSNMQELIDDLLEFSRVNTVNAKFAEFNLMETLKALKFELEETYPREFKMEIPRKEVILEADNFKINQLFKHLFINSLKFNDNPIPSIQVQVSEDDINCTICIIDNGIGIEKEFEDKVFLLFQKLHSVDKYEGSGIGLAICKKIVEQHGGEIWFDSEINQGTSFYIQLPKKQN